MIHQLKTEKQYFDAIAAGTKMFEVRKDDRGFIVGDFLALNELSFGEETGKCILVEVTYVLRKFSAIDPDFVVLGIKPCVIVNSQFVTVFGGDCK